MKRYPWALLVCCCFVVSASAQQDTTPKPMRAPQLITELSEPIEELWGGWDRVCARNSQNVLSCWQGATPLTIAALSHSKGATSVASGAHQACAVVEGAPRCWPLNAPADFTSPPLTDVVDIGVGNEHFCAHTTTGTVYCWGDNTQGQLGDGTPSKTARDTPTEVKGLPGPAKATAVAGDYACAIVEVAEATELWCWGLHWFQHQGRGVQSEPVRVPIDGSPRTLALSPSHTCVIRDQDQRVLCWGRSRAGELGDATTIDRQTPVVVDGLSGAVAVVVGMAHSCALTDDSQVFCWGRHVEGQLGDGSQAESSLVPVKVKGLDTPKALASSADTTCALLADGRVSCWGAPGEQGLEIHLAFLRQKLDVALRYPSRHTEENTIAPEPWFVLGVDDATQLSMRGEHVCLARASGTPACWGHNDERQLSDGTTISRNAPIVPLGLEDVIAVGASPHHSCAVERSGKMLCWGHNVDGQLGTGNNSRGKQPMRVKEISSAQAVSLSARHSCALLSDGTVSCWGANEAGQLGDGTQEERLLPVVVQGLAHVRTIVAAKRHSCALLEDGTVMCWGDNRFGQITPIAEPDAEEPPAFFTTPTALTELKEVVALVPGRLDDTCAIGSDGFARCWGAGWSGLERLDDLRDVRDLALSPSHACAVLGDSRSVYCWGDNAFGQLGDGTMLSRERSAPALVKELQGVVQIEVGFDSSCALLEEGTVACWGSNQRGQIGAGR